MTSKSDNTNNNVAAIIFAVFAVACIVAFLWFRGGDIGRIAGWMGDLSGGPFLGIGILHVLTGIAIAGIVYFSWRSLGSVILKPVSAQVMPERTYHIWKYEAIMVAAGAAGWSLLLFFLGVFGLYRSWVAWTLLGFIIVVGLFYGYRPLFKRPTREERHRWDLKSSRASRYALPAIFFLLFVTLISAAAPPIAKDALLYHFALPKAFLAQHGSSFIDGNIASYVALGSEMQSVLAMLLASVVEPVRIHEVAASVTSFLFFPILLVFIYEWARELEISRPFATIATLVVATVPTAYHVASSGYIDLSLALYITLATYGLTRWWKEQTWGWVIFTAIFLGAALSVKLTAVFVFAAFALIVLLRARETKNPVATAPGSDKTNDPAVAARGSDTAPASASGRIVLTGFAALLLAGVIASPWYIRTWVATGSPVFPFYMSVWKGEANGWDVERSNLFQAMNSQYGGTDVDKVNYLTAPVRVSVAAQPEQPANYDGVLGVAFLIGLPLLVWALWKFDLAVEIKIMSGVAAIMYLFWLFSSEQLRYLLPVVPLLAIAIAAAAEKIGGAVSKVARCALVAASVCGLLTTFAWFCQRAPLRVVLGGETRDEYLLRNLDYYQYYQWLNTETTRDSKVWLINMRRDTYNLDRPVFSDYLFEDWTLRKMVWEAQNVQELRAKTAALGIRYVLARHDFLFDYARSPLVDDKAPRAVNEAKLKMAKDFILDPASTVRADNKFSLIKVY